MFSLKKLEKFMLDGLPLLTNNLAILMAGASLAITYQTHCVAEDGVSYEQILFDGATEVALSAPFLLSLGAIGLRMIYQGPQAFEKTQATADETIDSQPLATIKTTLSLSANAFAGIYWRHLLYSRETSSPQCESFFFNVVLQQTYFYQCLFQATFLCLVADTDEVGKRYNLAYIIERTLAIVFANAKSLSYVRFDTLFPWHKFALCLTAGNLYQMHACALSGTDNLLTFDRPPNKPQVLWLGATADTDHNGALAPMKSQHIFASLAEQGLDVNYQQVQRNEDICRAIAAVPGDKPFQLIMDAHGSPESLHLSDELFGLRELNCPNKHLARIALVDLFSCDTGAGPFFHRLLAALPQASICAPVEQVTAKYTQPAKHSYQRGFFHLSSKSLSDGSPVTVCASGFDAEQATRHP